jgi:hypothetical protein
MGEGHVRFALIENDHRTRQAIRSIKHFLSATESSSLVQPQTEMMPRL